MLKDVLIILFYALFYSTTLYVVLRLTYKLGRYRAEEAMADEVARLRQSRWKEGYTIGREQGYTRGRDRGHKEGYREGYAKGRAEAMTMAEDTKPLPSITKNNLKR